MLFVWAFHFLLRHHLNVHCIFPFMIRQKSKHEENEYEVPANTAHSVFQKHHFFSLCNTALQGNDGIEISARPASRPLLIVSLSAKAADASVTFNNGNFDNDRYASAIMHYIMKPMPRDEATEMLRFM